MGTGAPIMNIAELNDMWVTFNVREDLLKDLTMGAEFEAIVPALDNKTIKLKVYYLKDLGSYAAWKATKTTGQFVFCFLYLFSGIPQGGIRLLLFL